MRKWKLGVCPGDRVCLRLIDNSEAPAVFFFNQLLTLFLNSDQYRTYGVANPGYMPAAEAAPGKIPKKIYIYKTSSLRV